MRARNRKSEQKKTTQRACNVISLFGASRITVSSTTDESGTNRQKKGLGLSITYSATRPTIVQLKRAVKVLTLIGATTKHAVCHTTFTYPIRSYRKE